MSRNYLKGAASGLIAAAKPAPDECYVRKEMERQMTITVFIEYRLDPFKRDRFEEYAKRWLEIIPRCGADLVGYWIPHEGTNDVGYALISCDSLASYEAYRQRLREDGAGMANLRFAQEERFIASERRTFLRPVEAD